MERQLGGTKERAFVLLANRRVADVGSSPEAAEFADLHAVEKHRKFVSSRWGLCAEMAHLFRTNKHT